MKDKTTITPQAAAVRPLRTELPDETSAGHTPEPWFIRHADAGLDSEGYNIEHEEGGKRSIVCHMLAAHLCDGHGNSKANADLLVSAPRLLRERDSQAAEIAKLRAALQGFIDEYENNGLDDGTRPELDQARAVMLAVNTHSTGEFIGESRAQRNGKSQPHAVKIEVSGGCAEVTECPESVRVTIIDHDNERDTI